MTALRTMTPLGNGALPPERNSLMARFVAAASAPMRTQGPDRDELLRLLSD
jgi:hypothetical protein